MQITQDQVNLVQARGHRFRELAPEEIARLSMQRRVLWLGSKALAAVRGDGFVETVATLQHLLDQAARSRQVPPPAAQTSPDRSPQATTGEAAGTVEVRESVEPAALAPVPAPARVPVPAPVARASVIDTASLVSAILPRLPVRPEDLPQLISAVHGSVCKLQR